MTPTPPTRRQIDEMTAYQAGQKELTLSWCTHCGEGITNFCRSKCRNRECPRGMPFLPAPSAGTCITPSPQGETHGPE